MKHLMPNRRDCLRAAGALLALPGLQAWSAESAQAVDGRLLVIFLRGGLDGLHAFAPVDDPSYAQWRPTLSPPLLQQGLRLGQSGFAAHPAASALADLYATGELLFAPCAGTSDSSRSHFQAQDVFEIGSGATHGASGFMARAADALQRGRGAISFTRAVPLAFQGADSAPQVAPLLGNTLRLPAGRALEAILSAHRGLPSGEALALARQTDAELESALQAVRMGGMEEQAARGAPGAGAFTRVAPALAQVWRSNPRLALGFMDLGGFDTHAGQDATLARSLADLGGGLGALRKQLGVQEWARTRVVVMSEFGRTVRENGTRGTDHGRGGLLLVCGGSVAGGRMLGDFAGLAPSRLNEGRDLPVLLDWRSVLAESMRQAYGWKDARA
jgi:uncharacterized protein (DUF1501 family)